jgi:ABC-2 type transport system permease protein
MGFISRLFPPSYVFEGMRTIISHGAVPVSGLLQGGCLTLLYLLLACLIFKRVYRQAVRTGLIARYSAESVG